MPNSRLTSKRRMVATFANLVRLAGMSARATGPAHNPCRSRTVFDEQLAIATTGVAADGDARDGAAGGATSSELKRCRQPDSSGAAADGDALSGGAADVTSDHGMDSEQAALREQTKRARRCEDERSLPAAAEDQQLPSRPRAFARGLIVECFSSYCIALDGAGAESLYTLLSNNTDNAPLDVARFFALAATSFYRYVADAPSGRSELYQVCSLRGCAAFGGSPRAQLTASRNAPNPLLCSAGRWDVHQNERAERSHDPERPRRGEEGAGPAQREPLWRERGPS